MSVLAIGAHADALHDGRYCNFSRRPWIATSAASKRFNETLGFQFQDCSRIQVKFITITITTSKIDNTVVYDYVTIEVVEHSLTVVH
jgi:hypothetical protein